MNKAKNLLKLILVLLLGTNCLGISFGQDNWELSISYAHLCADDFDFCFHPRSAVAVEANASANADLEGPVKFVWYNPNNEIIAEFEYVQNNNSTNRRSELEGINPNTSSPYFCSKGTYSVEFSVNGQFEDAISFDLNEPIFTNVGSIDAEDGTYFIPGVQDEIELIGTPNFTEMGTTIGWYKIDYSGTPSKTPIGPTGFDQNVLTINYNDPETGVGTYMYEGVSNWDYCPSQTIKKIDIRGDSQLWKLESVTGNLCRDLLNDECAASYSTATALAIPLADIDPEPTLIFTWYNPQGSQIFSGEGIKTSEGYESTLTGQNFLCEQGSYQVELSIVGEGLQDTKCGDFFIEYPSIAKIEVVNEEYFVLGRDEMQLKGIANTNNEILSRTWYKVDYSTSPPNRTEIPGTNGAEIITINKNDENTATGTYMFEFTAVDVFCEKHALLDIQMSGEPCDVYAGPDKYLTCNQSTVTLDASQSGYTAGASSFHWLDPNGVEISNELTVDVTEPGEYTFYVSEVFIFCPAIDYVTVGLDFDTPFLELQTPVVDPVLGCVNTNIEILAVVDDPNVDFLWTGDFGFQSTDNPIFVNEPGTYSVVATKQNGCFTSASITVESDFANPNVEVLVNDFLSCTTTEVQIFGSSNTTNIVFEWTGPNGFTSNVANPFVNVAGVYMLRVTNIENGCWTENSVEVFSTGSSCKADLIDEAILSCCNPFALLDASSSCIPAGATTSWTDEDGEILASDVMTLEVGFPGTYFFNIITQDCSSTDSTIVFIDCDPPLFEFTYLENTNENLDFCGDRAIMNPFTNDQFVDFALEDQDGNLHEDPPFIIVKEGEYQLIATNSENCATNSETILITRSGESCIYICGTVYFDVNTNCEKDIAEEIISGAEVSINNTNTTLTDDNGQYSFVLNSFGTYEFSVNHATTVKVSSCQYPTLVADGSTSKVEINLGRLQDDLQLAVTGKNAALCKDILSSNCGSSPSSFATVSIQKDQSITNHEMEVKWYDPRENLLYTDTDLLDQGQTYLSRLSGANPVNGHPYLCEEGVYKFVVTELTSGWTEEGEIEVGFYSSIEAVTGYVNENTLSFCTAQQLTIYGEPEDLNIADVVSQQWYKIDYSTEPATRIEIPSSLGGDQNELTLMLNDPLLGPGTYLYSFLDRNAFCVSESLIEVFYANSNNVDGCHLIQGLAYLDENSNCVFDFDEAKLNQWVVELKTGDEVRHRMTDENGFYSFYVQSGEHEINLIPLNNAWQACSGLTVQVPIGTGTGTPFEVDFGAKPTDACNLPKVNLIVPNLLRCFESPIYVYYENVGNQALEDAYIELELDEYHSIISSELDYELVEGNLYRFEIGDLGVFEKSKFEIVVLTSCDADLGKTHCFTTEIFPHDDCGNFSGEWDGSSIIVDGKEVQGEIEFTISNLGSDMTESLNWFIIEDDVLMKQGSFQLNVMNGNQITIPANCDGNTYRIEAEQARFHPGQSYPSLSIEGCSGEFTPGLVNLYAQDDEDLYKDIDCVNNVGSFDPNDKQGFPYGSTENRCVDPGRYIEYLIRFQNTGTAPAFNVEITDVIDVNFDLNTFEIIGASHEFTHAFNDNRQVNFKFEDINLPDIKSNKIGSNGFIKYKILPREDIILGTQVNNTAKIYFDFNEPVITNTTLHTISEDCIEIISSIEENLLDDSSIEIMPQPFDDRFKLKVIDQESSNLILHVYNARGQFVALVKGQGNEIEYVNKELGAGLYFYELYSESALLHTGKLICIKK